MDPESKGYMKLYNEMKLRQEELNIISDHLARHEQGNEFELSNAEKRGRQAYAQQQYNKKMGYGKPAKASSAPKASGTKASKAKGERESLDDLHAKARAARAKGGLPDEVKPEDVPRGNHGKLLLQPSPDFKSDVKNAPDPFATPDVHLWARMWGPHQLGAELTEHTREVLVRMAAKAGIAHPESIKTKAELVSRLTALATNGRYSADFAKSASPQKARSSSKVSSTKNTEGKSARPTKAELKNAPKMMPQYKVPNFTPDPFAQLDLRYYHRIYGSDRIKGALGELSITTLRTVADHWASEHPESGKPSNRTSKDALIDYLSKSVIAHDGRVESQADVDALQQSDPITGGLRKHFS